jgi:hypothetical protein
MMRSAKQSIALLVAGFLLTVGAATAHSQPAPAAASQSTGSAPHQHGMESCPCMAMGGGPMGGMMEMGGMGPGAMGPGAMGPGAMGPGAMGPGMMPMHEHMMMRMMARNPKLAGKMMQMRADIMRAVADVLTRYGKEMESGQWPAPAKGAGGE